MIDLPGVEKVNLNEKVVSLTAWKLIKEQERFVEDYRTNLLTLPKEDLLQELCDFYDLLKTNPFDLPTILRGHCLINIIKNRALTENLQDIAKDLEDYLFNEAVEISESFQNQNRLKPPAL